MASSLIKSVSIDIGVKGDQASKAKLDAITVKAEKLKESFPEYALKIDSAAATEKLAIFKGQMRSVSDEVTKPMDTVILTDKAKRKLLDVQAKAEELKARFPEFTLRIDDSAAKAKLAIFAAEAKVTTDVVDRELGNAGSGSGRGGILGKITSLFSSGGSGSGGSAASSAASSGGGLLSSPGGLTLAAGGLGIGAGLVPAAAGLGIGGAVGLGGLGLVALIATRAAATIKLDQAQVKAAKSAPQLAKANAQLAADMKANSPFIAITADIKGLLTPLQGILTPFAKGLAPIITGFGKGLTALGPQLTAMFKASLPFIRQFAGVMLQMGKTLIPVFTQTMNQMVKSGALKIMTQGLVILVQGVGQFITALGPGMRSSAILFTQITKGISLLLHGLGSTFSWIARVMEFVPSAAANRLRHALFATFNGIRHETAVIFDGVRHDIAHVWDLIWNNTIGREQRGIADVVRWFRGLPGKAVGALFGMGHSLASFARSAIGEMWSGFRNTFSSVIHWFQGLPRMILHALGVHSPPGWAVGAGKWIMKGLHIGLGHGLGQLTSFTTSIGAQVAGALSGALGGHMGDSGARTHSAAVAQAYARSLLSQYGWSQSQMSSLIPLWNQESGWSAYAVNQSSGAYGIPQSLGHGHPYNLGDYKNQIIWGLNYIRGRYGSPAAAERHELAYNWYDKGGWLMPGLTLAMNKTGKPEQILPPGGSGGVVRHIFEIRAPHGTQLERAVAEMVRHVVTVNGGDVQSALGNT